MPKDIPNSSQLVGYWDAVASSKPFRHPIPMSYIKRYFALSSAVLDVGCGRGRVVAELTRLGFHTSGTDTSLAMLSRARQDVPDCEFRQCTDVLPWEDDTFHVALLVAVLTSVPSGRDQHQLVREVKRVLRPNGHLFVSDMPLQWSARYLARYDAGLERYGQYGVFDLADGGTVRHHDLDYFMRLMSGFRCLELETHEVETMNGNRAHAFRYLGRL